MSYTENQLFHVERVKARLATVAVKEAFDHLLGWAEGHRSLALLPISRGAFSSIHLSTRRNPRPYADCEMGFKGAKDHLRWYFRKPGFASGLFQAHQIESLFVSDRNLKAGEMMTNVHSLFEAKAIVAHVEERLNT